MAIDYETVKSLQEKLRSDELYSGRLEDFARLRKLWHGGFWEQSDSDSGNVSSVFRDMVQESNVSPDLKLVNNLLQQVCVKYQTFLSPIPMIRVFSDYEPDGNTMDARRDANLKERYLYGLWSQRPQGMNSIMNTAAWYLPLFGDCFLGINPNPDTNTPMPFIRSPENAYPIPNYSDGTLEKVIFKWEVTEEMARASFGNEAVDKADRAPQSSRLKGGRRKRDGNFEILEYSDKKEFGRWLSGHKTHGIQHDYGFNLFEQIGFIQVPNEPWNHGAVEQLVGLVEMGNALLSLSFQAVLENVFPTMFLINPMKMPEELNLGPGGVVPLNEGGDVKWVSPPTGAVATQMAMLQNNEQSIKQGASMPDVMFGQSDASIITGKAVNELQGAGTGSVIEMVQGTSLGTALVSWNEKAIFMGQRMYKNETAHLFGLIPDSGIDINPKQFSLSLKGKELKGSARNEVVFSPHTNTQQKVVMGLQMAGAGLVSKKWQRDQVGIPDNDAMEEEIYSEAINDAVLQAHLQAVMATNEQAGGADFEAAVEAEKIAVGYMQGRTQPAAAPPVAPAAGGQPPPLGGPPLPAGGPPLPGEGLGPPGGPPALPPAPGAEVGPPMEGEGIILLGEAMAAFQLVEVEGRVWLVGEIVERGEARNIIDVALTEREDRQTLVSGLPQYQGRLNFLLVEGEPQEINIEVTPGADTEPRGAELDPFAGEDDDLLEPGALEMMPPEGPSA